MSPKRRKSGKSAPVKRVLVRPWEAAEALAISETKAYDLMGAGEIPFVLVGNSRRIPVQWLEDRGKWPSGDE